MSAPGTRLTFDVSGTLRGDGAIAIGCKVFTMRELTDSAQSVTTGRDNVVTVRGAQGTVGERDIVTFEGTGNRQFLESQVRGVARNLRVEEPAARAATADAGPFAPGSVLEATRGRKTKLYVVGQDEDGPVVFRVKGDAGWDPDLFERELEAQGWTWSVVGAEDAENGAAQARSNNPDPATLRWQDGDMVVWVENKSGPRYRDTEGRWWRENGARRRPGRRWEWTDERYDRMIRQGKVRIIRKGGVNFT